MTEFESGTPGVQERADLRATVSLVARYGVVDGAVLFEGVGTNLSPTGMFIGTRRPLNVDTQIRIDCEPYDREGRIIGTARVVWSRRAAEGQDRPAGMGIEFVELEAEGRALIDELRRTGDASSAGSSGRSDPPEAPPDDVPQASATAPQAPPAPSSGAEPAGPAVDPDLVTRTFRLSALIEETAQQEVGDEGTDGEGDRSDGPQRGTWILVALVVAAALVAGGLALWGPPPEGGAAGTATSEAG